MKATDLMIGDWVVYNGDVEYTDPIKIEGMDIATDMLITSDREDVGFEGVEPIPLDSEIMKKFGFCCSYDDYHQWHIMTKDGNLWLEQSRTELHTYFMRVFTDIKVRYVHELQHALKLCGIEKEIEL